MSAKEELTIVNQLSYENHSVENVKIDGCPAIDIRHHRIVLVASLTEPDVLDLPENASRFPIVLDTGFNGNGLIKAQHLRGCDFLAAGG